MERWRARQTEKFNIKTRETMAIQYKATLNKGNEALRTGPTITVNEDLRPASDGMLASWIHYKNALIPEDVAAQVLGYFCDAAVALMSQGLAIHLKHRGVTMLRIFPDLHVKGGTLTLERARQLDPTVSELTPEVVRRLIARAGIEVKVHASVNPKFHELLSDYGFDTECAEVEVRDVVRRRK